MRISDWSSDVCSSDLELIDHHLRAVDEIAELGFPDRKDIGFGRCVSVLERQDGLFGKHGIDNGVWRLVIGDILQRNVGAVVPAFALLVVQHGMAVRKRAPPGILARDAARIARRDREITPPNSSHSSASRMPSSACK